MRLILHAGTGKTGTSTIQHVLADNREHLSKQHGLVYPDAGGSHHHKFARDLIFARRTGAAQKFLRGLEGTDSIISSEIIYRSIDEHDGYNLPSAGKYWIARKAYLDRLASVFSKFSVRVVLFFRDQPAYTEALYSTLVLSGRTASDFATHSNIIDPLRDYDRQVEMFKRYFDEVVSASYDDAKNNLVPSFCEAAGIPELSQTPTRRNITPDARLIYWMAERNRTRLPTGREVRLRRRFVQTDLAQGIFPDYGRASFQPDHNRPIPAESAPLDRIEKAFSKWARWRIFA